MFYKCGLGLCSCWDSGSCCWAGERILRCSCWLLTYGIIYLYIIYYYIILYSSNPSFSCSLPLYLSSSVLPFHSSHIPLPLQSSFSLIHSIRVGVYLYSFIFWMDVILGFRCSWLGFISIWFWFDKCIGISGSVFWLDTYILEIYWNPVRVVLVF